MEGFAATQLGPFWFFNSGRGDQAFQHSCFSKLKKSKEVTTCTVPPWLHSKTILERKHGIITSIRAGISDANPTILQPHAALQATGISNYLYGNSIPTAFDISRGFTRPIYRIPIFVPSEIKQAQDGLQAKRKLALILHSESITGSSKFVVGDMVEVLIKRDNDKRGKWSSPQKVID